MKISRILAPLALVTLMTTTHAASGDFSDAQKKQIQSVVRDYLIQNPDVVIQSLQTFQQRQADQAKQTIQKTQDNSPKFADALFHQANDPMVGNAQAKITLVEFFDYQCPHCVDMTPVIEDLVSNNKDVRVVFKEFPIRGPVSEFASRAALAAHEQGKYFEFHKGLMDSKQQPLTQDLILQIAKDNNLDIDKLKKDMNSSVVDQQIKANYKLAQDLQLLGTPAFFIAKSDVNKNTPSTAIVFIPGQVDKNQLQTFIQKIK